LGKSCCTGYIYPQPCNLLINQYTSTFPLPPPNQQAQSREPTSLPLFCQLPARVSPGHYIRAGQSKHARADQGFLFYLGSILAKPVHSALSIIDMSYRIDDSCMVLTLDVLDLQPTYQLCRIGNYIIFMVQNVKNHGSLQ